MLKLYYSTDTTKSKVWINKSAACITMICTVRDCSLLAHLRILLKYNDNSTPNNILNFNNNDMTNNNILNFNILNHYFKKVIFQPLEYFNF